MAARAVRAVERVGSVARGASVTAAAKVGVGTERAAGAMERWARSGAARWGAANTCRRSCGNRSVHRPTRGNRRLTMSGSCQCCRRARSAARPCSFRAAWAAWGAEASLEGQVAEMVAAARAVVATARATAALEVGRVAVETGAAVMVTGRTG